MKKAILIEGNTEREVDAADLTINDRNKIYRCPVCGAKAFLNVCCNSSGKTNWFSSNYHRETCCYAVGVRAFRVTDEK